MAYRTLSKNKKRRQQRKKRTYIAQPQRHRRGDTKRRRYQDETKQHRIVVMNVDTDCDSRRGAPYRSKEERFLLRQMHGALRLLPANVKELIRQVAELLIRAFPTAALAKTRLRPMEKALRLIRDGLSSEARKFETEAAALAQNALTRASECILRQRAMP